MRVLAFLMIALGAMIEILGSHFGITSEWKWIEDLSWVIVGVGIMMWIQSKRLQKQMKIQEKEDGN
jgi:hypothetical protein